MLANSHICMVINRSVLLFCIGYSILNNIRIEDDIKSINCYSILKLIIASLCTGEEQHIIVTSRYDSI